jgi:hypothetical protein
MSTIILPCAHCKTGDYVQMVESSNWNSGSVVCQLCQQSTSSYYDRSMAIEEWNQKQRAIIKEETETEIERLKAFHKSDGNEWNRIEGLLNSEVASLKSLITELVDALEEEVGESLDLMQSQQQPWSLIRKAREAVK